MATTQYSEGLKKLRDFRPTIIHQSQIKVSHTFQMGIYKILGLRFRGFSVLEEKTQVQNSK
jgi:hypothetical protein